MALISELWIYPIKGCAGIRIPFLPLTEFGAHLDRHWMLIDDDGKFLSQREIPKLAQIRLSMDLQNWGVATDQVSVEFDSTTYVLRFQKGLEANQSVTLWGQGYQAHLDNSELSGHLSRFLDRPVRLVQAVQQTQRKVSKKYQDRDAQTAFADGYPLLAVFAASLDDLNSKLETPVSHHRFRANVVVSNPGETPFSEEQIKVIAMGHEDFTIKPCARCVVITVDQSTGERHRRGEPLKTLASYRNQNGKINFGINLVHNRPGILHEGDLVYKIE